MTYSLILEFWSPETWQAVGVWGTGGIAGAAAIFARKQVLEARQLREAQAQPFIVVTLEPSTAASHIINLRVENIGQTLARDVRFTFSPPLSSVLARKRDGYDLNQGRLLTEGIPTMPPGMKVERIFDNAVEWEDGKNRPDVMAYDVVVSYRDHRGKPQESLEYRIDLAAYLSGRYVEVKTIHHVATSLREIRDALKKLG